MWLLRMFLMWFYVHSDFSQFPIAATAAIPSQYRRYMRSLAETAGPSGLLWAWESPSDPISMMEFGGEHVWKMENQVVKSLGSVLRIINLVFIWFYMFNFCFPSMVDFNKGDSSRGLHHLRTQRPNVEIQVLGGPQRLYGISCVSMAIACSDSSITRDAPDDLLWSSMMGQKGRPQKDRC